MDNLKSISTYCVGQLEKAPTTGRIHVQAYAVLKSQLTLPQIQDAMHNPVHVEPVARGDEERTADYCKKIPSRVEPPIEHGIPPAPSKQGHRTDLESLREALLSGDVDIRSLLSNPSFKVGTLLQLAPKIIQLQALAQAPKPARPRDENLEPQVRIYVGKSGGGKSVAAKEWLREDGRRIYQGSYSNNFWDGAAGTRTESLLMDEYSGKSLPYSLLKQVIHAGTVPINVKYDPSACKVTWTRIAICSNIDIESWYTSQGPDFLQPLYRVIDEIRVYRSVYNPRFNELGFHNYTLLKRLPTDRDGSLLQQAYKEAWKLAHLPVFHLPGDVTPVAVVHSVHDDSDDDEPRLPNASGSPVEIPPTQPSRFPDLLPPPPLHDAPDVPVLTRTESFAPGSSILFPPVSPLLTTRDFIPLTGASIPFPPFQTTTTTLPESSANPCLTPTIEPKTPANPMPAYVQRLLNKQPKPLVLRLTAAGKALTSTPKPK